MMVHCTSLRTLVIVFFMIVIMSPTYLHAGEGVNKAGEITGVTVGNLIFVPLKVAIMGFAAPVAVISWLGSLGDTKQVKAIWKDSTDTPYFISPKEARKAIGKRPDLTAEWNPTRDYEE